VLFSCVVRLGKCMGYYHTLTNYLWDIFQYIKKYHIMGTKYDRLEQFRDILGLTKSAMAKSMGIDQSQYSHILNPKRPEDVTYKHLIRLYEAFNLNEGWVLDGKGSMIMVNYHNTILCPYIANAGNVIPIGHQWEDQSERVQIPGVNVESVAFQVSGDSMEPMLRSGDHLICIKLDSAVTLRDNSVYLLITTEGIYVKEILRLPEQLLLRSKNKSHPDLRILLPDVLAIYQPLCKITTFIDEASYHSDINKIKDLLASKFPGEI
jgi:transcriptional regulator with XRE-family HTH domain